MQFLQLFSDLAFLPDSCVSFELTLFLDSVPEPETTSSSFVARTLSAIFFKFSAVNSCDVSIIPSSIFLGCSTFFSLSLSHHHSPCLASSSLASCLVRTSTSTVSGSTAMFPLGSR
ncbi:hypothetical protein Hanom_Chr02g00137981 [Helianthus anomalus]